MQSEIISSFSKDIKVSVPANPEHYIEIVRVDDPHKAADVHHLDDHKKVPQPFAISDVLEAKIVSSNLLVHRESDVKQVYEIDFTVTPTATPQIQYAAGNTIGILPENRPEDVKFVLTRILEDADGLYKMQVATTTKKKNAKLPAYVPTSLSIENVLLHCLDLNSIPKKLFLRALIEYTSEQDEKRFLEILCSKEGATTYANSIVNQKFTFLDMLRALKSCEPSLVVLLEHLPRLLPRPYSIASFNSENLNNFKIVFSVQHEEASICGLTTRMLVEKIESDLSASVYFYLRQPTAFQYTIEDLDKNVIMIGPGTGVAPFLGFLEFRQHFLKDAGGTEAWLFTGCRFEKKNNLYDNRIRTYLNEGVLNTHSAAFSRDPSSRCKYVQDAIVGQKEKFVKLLVSDRTKLYVCGEGKNMLPGIEATIITCLETENNQSSDEAKAMVVALKKNGRYIEDVWF